ncbi:MAG TPA: response regulator [Candidatus Limnocylindria bacterium]
MKDTILVLEDDDDIRTVLADLLREAGFAAVQADHNGHLPELRGVGLVLTDLPKTADGYSSGCARDWVAAVRDRYLAPVIVITAHSEAARDDMLSTIAATVITKPFDLDDLVAHIRTLGGSSTSDDAR